MLVDARNVLRSRWPNIPEHDLVALAGRWARERGVTVHLVFDGRPPQPHGAEGAAVTLLGSGPRSADDVIADLAAQWRLEGRSFELVTSDRELRRRAGEGAKVTGGGTFARALLALADA